MSGSAVPASSHPPARRLFALSLLLLATACLSTRDRLSPPRVTLALADQTVLAGGEIFGTISAADESGITYVSAQVRIEGDTARPRASSADVSDRDTVQFAFQLTVRNGFPSGTPVYVTAFVRDNQNFLVSKQDTIAIR